MESSSLQRTPASEDGGEGFRSYWLMKSEPESRLEKGVDVKGEVLALVSVVHRGDTTGPIAHVLPLREQGGVWSGTSRVYCCLLCEPPPSL